MTGQSGPNDDDILLLRQELQDFIPKDLDTDHNLARWHIAYGGDLAKIRENFANYVHSRAAAGYDEPDLLHPICKKYLPYLSLSRLDDRAFNERDNTIVYVQHLRHIDMHKILKFVPMTDWLQLFFLSNEYNLRLVLNKEREIGKHVAMQCQYGDSAMQLIFDLDGFHVADYLNPFCPPLKCAGYMSMIWLNWYSELIHSIVVTNAPNLVSKLWAIISPFLPHTHRSRVHFTNDPKEILKHLGNEPEIMPATFEGGKLRDDSGWSKGREGDCVNEPKVVGDAELQSVCQIWAEKCLSPNPTKHSIKSGKSFTVMRTCVDLNSDAELLWHFSVNGDVTFHAFYVPQNELPRDESAKNSDPKTWCDLDGKLLKYAIFSSTLKPYETWKEAKWIFPKLTFSTPNLAEQQCMKIDKEKPGIYCLHFENASSSWFALQLEYDVRVLKKN